ncbi:chorismate mutase [Endobacter medicaginis]|uniref:chorismate mutase n=3 Tax=Endobacter medicaginis TaxID=1181271 RepID=A0A839V2D6_9PROT|nr:chorismate mutase [Endobacter medicaginis]
MQMSADQTETVPSGADDADPMARLRALRGSIDNIDAAVIHMLAERFRCTQEVGRLKARHHLPPADPAREAEQIARLRRLALDARLDPDFAEKFLAFVIREVIRHHEAFPRGHESAPALAGGVAR